ASYLIANEKVLQSWKRGSWNIFATNYRIILKKKSFFSKEIVEASYNYISSIEEKISSDVLGGIIFLIIGLTLLYLHLYPPIVFGLYNAMNDPLVSTVFLSTGLLFIGIGSLFLFERKRIFKFHIVGRDPIILPGKLEPMIRWVREYKQSSQ
ncbi:hypothetical protein KAX03_03000, partial [Candidatus Bathyarchaeota archaeon]|nr:hypothetical protein [Candidatus Bathyarchaeota archaeon]